MNPKVSPWLIVFVLGLGYLAYRTFSGEMGLVYVQEMNGVETQVAGTEYVAGSAKVSPFQSAGLWIAALLTLFILSFAYKDNPFYKFAEAILIGVSAAYWMVVSFWTVLVPNLMGKLFPAFTQQWATPGVSPMHEPHWQFNLIPLALGIMLLWRLMPVGNWISRWPLAFIIGATAGLRLIGFIEADFLSQIKSSIMPLIVMVNGEFNLKQTALNWLMTLSVFACIVYFFFSIEHKGVVGKVSKVGIWVLMITFGAAFGNTVMGRIALLAIRLEFLFDDWLWLIDPTLRRIGL